jgi:hypothetical protein
MVVTKIASRALTRDTAGRYTGTPKTDTAANPSGLTKPLLSLNQYPKPRATNPKPVLSHGGNKDRFAGVTRRDRGKGKDPKTGSAKPPGTV